MKNARPISLNVEDEAALDTEVSKVDVAISLIPYTYHALVIKSAIRKKVNVVTTSYISPAMQELESQINEAGITVMNEIGLDPGIDHLYAIKTIAEVHKAGGKINSFLSYCGGLRTCLFPSLYSLIVISQTAQILWLKDLETFFGALLCRPIEKC